MTRESLGVISPSPFVFLEGQKAAAPKAPCEVIRFSDLDEFVGFVESTKDQPTKMVSKDGNQINLLTTLDSPAAGGASYDETRKMVRRGWKQGTNLSKGLLDGIEERFHSKRLMPRREYGVAGGMPDIPVALSGDPESFMVREYDPNFGRGKIARLRVAVGADWNVGPKALMLRGICLIAAIDALERGGISTEIDLIYPCFLFDSEEWTSLEIPLKSSNTICDDDRLSFCIGHPSFCRRYVLRALQVLSYKGGKGSTPWRDLAPQDNDLHFPPLKTYEPNVKISPWNDDERLIDYHLALIEENFVLV